MHIAMMESLLQDGKLAAQEHFETLIAATKKVLPESFWPEIPANMDDMGGLFSASSKTVYLSFFTKMDDYHPINANFKYLADQSLWVFDKFSLTVGVSVFGREFYADTLADAIFVSRKIASWKTRAELEEKMAFVGDTDKQPVLQ